MPCLAQVPVDTTRRDSTRVVLDELVVRVGRPVATAGGASAVVVRIDPLQTPPAPSLDQALRSVPFVQVRTNSRGESQLSLRGAEARQVAVLVDGVPLTLGWDHRADLSGIPVGGATSITLVRGLSSVLHGPNVLGGVVEVDISHGVEVPADDTSLQLRLGVDHLGGHSASGSGTLAAAAGTWRVRGGMGFRNQPGLALARNVGSTGELRENSDLRHADAFVSARFGSSEGIWGSVSAFGSRAERGVPPELHLSSPRFWRYPDASRALLALSGGTGQRSTPLGRGDLEASLGVDIGSTEIQSFSTSEYQELAGSESADDRTLTLRLLGDHTLGRWAGLRAAATFADVRHDEFLDPGGAARYRQRLWSLGSEIAMPLAGGGRVSGGFALDGADTPETGDKPPLDPLTAWGGRIGANILVSEAVLLHAATSRRARFPSLRELYSGALRRFIPNPELRPERLLAGEAGLTVQADGHLEVQAVVFHQRLADAIVRVSAGGGRFRRENQGDLHSTGLELLANGGWRALSLAGEVTLQRVRVLNSLAAEGQRVEYQPSVVGGLDVSAALGWNLRAGADVDLVGHQWCVHPELEQEVRLQPSARTDLFLERAWRWGARALRTGVALDNAADAAVYDQCGLPQPGRTLRLQAEIGV